MPTADHWDASRYDSAARFVTELGAPVLDLLAPQAGERILDLGCGDGVLTERIAAAGADVIGLDASADMVAAAKTLGVQAMVGSGTALPFEAEFDAVFSNAALHWMTEPEAVIAGVHRALKPGGRFVAEFGALGNVAAIHLALTVALAEQGVEDDLTSVWYFPSRADHLARLEAGGFTVRSIELIPRPTPITAGMRAWLEVLAAPALARAQDRERLLDRTIALVEPVLCDGGGNWFADYVRLRFAAVRP